MFEHAAQMVDRFVRTGLVEAGMGQRDRPAGQAPQQLLDSGRAFPGQDAGGPIDPAQRLDDRGHSVAVLSAVDHHRGQILAKGAPRTGCAPIEVAFGSAASTGEVTVNSRARQTDRPPSCIHGKAGENAVVAALGADTASVHRCVKAAVAQLLSGPGHSALVGHSLTSAAAKHTVIDGRAAPFG
jgi:hypothetical protein